MRNSMKKWNKSKYSLVMLLLAVMLATSGCTSIVKEGTELLEEGNYTEAAEKFQESVDKGKDLGEAWRGLGICYWEEEDYEKAEKAFGNALQNGSEETATIFNMLGICALMTDKPEKAVYYFENGQEFPDAGQELLKEMSFNLIAAYEQVGDYQKAKEKLEVYLSLYPDDERALKEKEFLNTQVPSREE